MIPYFETPERQQALDAEIASWTGTRFWRSAGKQAKKGVGADCVSFVAKVLENTGAIKPFEWPRYTVFGGGNEMLALILKTMDAIPEMTCIWSPEDVADPAVMTIPGDIWVRSVKLEMEGEQMDYHHLSIYVGGNTVIHMRERGLSRANVHDRFALKQLQAVYRVYEQPSSQGPRDGA